MEQFKEILQELIFEKGLSLRKLQEESKISAMQYSSYLRGVYPTIEVAQRLCNYFNCSLDYLFGISQVKLERKLKDIDLTKFIERYEETLKQNNITHWKFAQKYNFSESCLRHWKSGNKPRIEILIIIADNLSTSIDYLLGRY